MTPAPRPYPNPAFFASRTLAEHLLRGALGVAGFGLAIHFSLARPWPMAASLVVMLVAWRGCPRCWLVGLMHTLDVRAERREALAAGCPACQVRENTVGAGENLARPAPTAP